jgi:selenocysteine-specific elongation factor
VGEGFSLTQRHRIDRVELRNYTFSAQDTWDRIRNRGVSQVHVIGMAGHVDHGKSALVNALTGIDPDRLKEEKERGMTIDLGFAWLSLPSGQTASIVDVPGHEDFIKNMVAGVGGIDVALLVIAADDGVMPQTREHLSILDLLQVKRGIVALNKIDLIEDTEWLELVEADIAGLLEGSSLQEAEIVPVSSKTRQGLESLVVKLDRLLGATPQRPDLGRPRLSVDRVFTIVGFGTVVTGTLVDGRFRVGEEVEILPAGIKGRIRGLQTHRQKIEEAFPGSRVAVNLTGLSTDQVQRGDVVTTPGWLKPTQLIDMHLKLLSDIPRPLRHNAEVEFFNGSAHLMARVQLLEGKQIEPGGTGWVQLRLADPTALVEKDGFIIRQSSPSMTLGGGMIVDSHPKRRSRRTRAETIHRLEILAHGTVEEILLEALKRREPCPAKDLIRQSGLSVEATQIALGQLLASGKILVLGFEGQGRPQEALTDGNPPLISASGWAGLGNRMTEMLRKFHHQYPLRTGMQREELRSQLQVEARFFNELIDTAVKQGAVSAAETTVRLPGHEVRFGSEQQSQIRKLLSEFERTPYTPPTVGEAEAIVGKELFYALVDQGTLVKMNDEICFLKQVYERMTKRVVEHLQKKGKITIADVRDMFGSSRKYALPFLGYLDNRGITLRVGDDRVLRQNIQE